MTWIFWNTKQQYLSGVSHLPKNAHHCISLNWRKDGVIPGRLPKLDKLIQRVMVEQGIDDRVLKRQGNAGQDMEQTQLLKVLLLQRRNKH